MNFRLDAKSKFRWERTDNGYRVFATIGKANLPLVYKDSNGIEHTETIKEDQLFDDRSIETTWGLPILIGHPKSGRYQNNKEQIMIGSTLQEIIRTDDNSLVISSVITDKRGVELIDKYIDSEEKPEISPGYFVRGLKKDGEIYQQIGRRYDHLALIPPGTGRAGNQVGIRLDIAEETEETKSVESIDTEAKTFYQGKFMGILINDQVFDINDDNLIAAITKLKTDLAEKQSTIEELELETEQANARSDSLEEKVKNLESQVSELKTDTKSDQDIEKLVAEEVSQRLDAWNLAANVLEEDRDPNLSSITIKRLALAKLKGINLDATSDENIEFLWEIEKSNLKNFVNPKSTQTRTDIDRSILNNRTDQSQEDPLKAVKERYRNPFS